MNALSYSALRSNLASTMESVCDNHDPVIITKKRDPSVVMISLEDYEAMEETASLLQNPVNAARLLKSLEDAQKGNFVTKTLAELEDIENA
ncbi:MAG: type II toxin-antitoxin system prevent-host-death family antitoxin [Victivallaceae bacterium]|nr:type II toxin-antitoxin system prevent-host-death family antitoxin [Victivallaceae bacterium]